MIELLIYIIAGIILGTITGLIPGLHANAVSFFLLTLPLAGDINLAATVIALAITHSFLDFVPSIYLGAPDSSSLSVLPGHKMLLEGKGLEALALTVAGGLLGIALLSASLPFLFLMVPKLYSTLEFWIPSILLAVTAFSILDERKLLPAMFVVLASGVLGIMSLKFGEVSLLSGLAGFFGVSTLLHSVFTNTVCPRQTEYRATVGAKESAIGSIAGFLTGAALSLLPAMGASQAGMIVQKVVRGDDRTFLVSLGAINSVVTIVSVLTLFMISRARSGIAVAVERILGVLSINSIIELVGVGMLSAGIAALLTLWAGTKFSKLLRKISYRKISILVITLLLIEVGITGWFGVVLLTASTFIGLYAQFSGVKRSLCMAFLAIPTTLLYL